MDLKDVLGRLTEPIPENEINWKPQVVKVDEGYALMVAYVDARWVAQRLDEATDGDWHFTFDVLDKTTDSVVIKGCVTACGITREDVGEYKRERQGDDMEMFKAAVSDAFKRAAVMFGVGRELYSLPIQKVKWNKQWRRMEDGEQAKLDSAVRRSRQGQEKQKADTKPERNPMLKALDSYVAMFDKAFDVEYVSEDIVQAIYPSTEIGNLVDDIATIKVLVSEWFMHDAVTRLAEGKKYDFTAIKEFVAKNVTDNTAAGLPKRYAAIKKWFEEN